MMKYFFKLSATVFVLIFSLTSCRLHQQNLSNVLDVDGNVYHVIKIGNQVWLKENLKVTHYNNGDSISYFKYEKVIYRFTAGKMCDYENNPENTLKNGKLYNWFTTVEKRNLCPSGWHVPSDIEWTELANYLGGDSVAGGKLKDINENNWQSPNVGATNETGFSAVSGGAYYTVGAFSSIGSYGYWWSSTKCSPTYAWGVGMGYPNKSLSRGSYNMDNCFSVRCIKDTESNKK